MCPHCLCVCQPWPSAIFNWDDFPWILSIGLCRPVRPSVGPSGLPADRRDLRYFPPEMNMGETEPQATPEKVNRPTKTPG